MAWLGRCATSIPTTRSTPPVYVNKLNVGCSCPAALGWPPGRAVSLACCRLVPSGRAGEPSTLAAGFPCSRPCCSPLRTILREDKLEEEEVYIAGLHNSGARPCFAASLPAALHRWEQKRRFIESARQQGEFYSVLVGISRTGPAGHQLFTANELTTPSSPFTRPAGRGALERGGVGELTDTTQATLFRLGIAAHRSLAGERHSRQAGGPRAALVRLKPPAGCAARPGSGEVILLAWGAVAC